ncbi:[citrate (pro-3S)-lyase] ligase [Vibrio sp. JC009]|uniref:[citrate (pro-3S)-lyase] ligase n=1 Tax=Vibrio sp. JC009 TaxID=2912314 RepID=UPI0023B01F0D|nr:[citrate (pro-3S)-lyase] ligase [Vibrio sp. JC009]WED23942.1 [citrate (pro-3S)-lyase] ligase [Vibrio sp. JC009]
MLDSYHFEKVINGSSKKMDRVRAFLDKMDLGVDVDVEFFVVAYHEYSIVGCGGLAGNTIKSVAVDDSHQGNGLSTKLLTELVTQAYDMGRYNLFIYTKPENYQMFHNAGFYLLTSVKDRVILLENSKNRLQRYCNKLATLRQQGDKIGSIVMNANPFTLGHRYLVERASKESDWVHLFVVKEDSSFFNYEDRLNMIRAGVEEFGNVIVHPGSDYMISRATFPSYFLKDEGIINFAHTAIDLQLFRSYLAPALGITHRFVGTEPICKVTNFYNQQMHQWLATPTLESDPISLIEIPRCEEAELPISASLVRNLLFQNRWDDIKKIVPVTTFDYLRELFSEETSAYQAKREQAKLNPSVQLSLEA